MLMPESGIKPVATAANNSPDPKDVQVYILSAMKTRRFSCICICKDTSDDLSMSLPMHTADFLLTLTFSSM